MKCVNHPNNEAVLICNKCNAAYCRECILQIKGKNYCRVCYNRNVIKHYKQKIDNAKIICGHCSSKIDKSSKFCMYCGNKISNDDFKNSTFQKIRNNPTKQMHFNLSKIELFKHSLLIGLIFLFISIFIIRKYSCLVNYSNILLVFLPIITFITSIYFIYLTIKFYKQKKQLLTIRLSILASIFFCFTISGIVEINRINSIHESYQYGLVKIQEKDWDSARYIFDRINKKTCNYKNTITLLELTTDMINGIKAELLIQEAWKDIGIKNYENALSKIKQAITIVGFNQDIYDVFYKACEEFSSLSERNYWKKNYSKAKIDANKLLKYLPYYPKEYYRIRDKYREKANRIIKNSDKKIKEAEELAKQQRIAQKNAMQQKWNQLPNN